MLFFINLKMLAPRRIKQNFRRAAKHWDRKLERREIYDSNIATMIVNQSNRKFENACENDSYIVNSYLQFLIMSEIN